MNTSSILKNLRTERARIERAISALEGLDGAGSLKATASRAQPVKARGRRKMSPAGRRRISEMMKARWAARRKKVAKPALKKGAHKQMSAATKKRLSLLAKRRWAARKKAAKA